MGAFICAMFISGVFGGLIGSKHDKTVKGFLLGLMLGPVGWVLALLDAGVLPITVALIAVVGGAYTWLRVHQEDRHRALHDRERTEALQSEQESHRRGAASGPEMTLLDLQSAFQEENPGGVVRDPKQDVTVDFWNLDDPPRGEIRYARADGREVRLFFRWKDQRWQFQSQALRKSGFFDLNQNEPGSESDLPPSGIEGYLSNHQLLASGPAPPAVPPVAPIVQATPPPVPRTPTPQEIQAARARAQAAEIARKYGQ